MISHEHTKISHGHAKWSRKLSTTAPLNFTLLCENDSLRVKWLKLMRNCEFDVKLQIGGFGRF